MNFIQEHLIETIPIPWFTTNGINVFALRLDKVHPIISGNKWYKLHFYLAEILLQQKKRVVSFGGAYSNHLLATAAVCNYLGLESAGIIRGEQPKNFSVTLKDLEKYGMNLLFVSRFDYAEKLLPPLFLSDADYIIPEGGFGMLGAKGAATIPYNELDFDYICCAVGTGTMMAGLLQKKTSNTIVLGFSVLKNNIGVEEGIRSLLLDPNISITINHNYHFGGYAKYTRQLTHFMNKLYEHTGIPTDFVYTAKLFYGVQQQILQKKIPKGKSILIIHSGGLQGNRSLPKGTLIF